MNKFRAAIDFPRQLIYCAVLSPEKGTLGRGSNGAKSLRVYSEGFEMFLFSKIRRAAILTAAGSISHS
jgi:hypothetical protein